LIRGRPLRQPLALAPTQGDVAGERRPVAGPHFQVPALRPLRRSQAALHAKPQQQVLDHAHRRLGRQLQARDAVVAHGPVGGPEEGEEVPELILGQPVHRLVGRCVTFRRPAAPVVGEPRQQSGDLGRRQPPRLDREGDASRQRRHLPHLDPLRRPPPVRQQEGMVGRHGHRPARRKLDSDGGLHPRVDLRRDGHGPHPVPLEREHHARLGIPDDLIESPRHPRHRIGDQAFPGEALPAPALVGAHGYDFAPPLAPRALWRRQPSPRHHRLVLVRRQPRRSHPKCPRRRRRPRRRPPDPLGPRPLSPHRRPRQLRPPRHPIDGPRPNLPRLPRLLPPLLRLTRQQVTQQRLSLGHGRDHRLHRDRPRLTRPGHRRRRRRLPHHQLRHSPRHHRRDAR
jgi:hypothetical protein